MVALDQRRLDVDVAAAFAPGFSAAGCAPPQLRWRPDDAELGHPILSSFALLVRRAADARGRLWRAGLDLAAFSPVRDWLMLVEPDAGGTLRYALNGPGIVEHLGRSVVGWTVSDFGGHLGAFLGALYAEAARRREPVLSVHEPTREVFVTRWRRLIHPLREPDGSVRAFLLVCVPENELRAGLDIVPDPVLIADGDQRVHYLNRAARELLRLDRFEAPRRTLRDKLGFALPVHEPPEALVGRSPLDLPMHLAFHDAIAQRCMVTVSAAMHRGRAYYVVMLRLLEA